MTTINLDDAAGRLSELIDRMHAGDEIVITRDDRPIARLVREAAQEKKPRQPGTLKGTVTHMAPDFDAPLEDFKEYMP